VSGEGLIRYERGRNWCRAQQWSLLFPKGKSCSVQNSRRFHHAILTMALTRKQRLSSALLVWVTLLSLACTEKSMVPTEISLKLLSEEQLRKVAAETVLFGHRSVGDNIVQGLRDLAASDSRFKLRIIHSTDFTSVSGPALIEFYVGVNGHPELKDEGFAAALDRPVGTEVGVAMYKYCFVDINASTDVEQLFEHYRRTVSALKAKHRFLTFVHITVPLTTAEPTVKARIESVLGRHTARDDDAKRNQFNDLLRQTYGGTDPIFDLAEVESTHLDGSRSYFMQGEEKIYTLAPEYTMDGGHLNQLGRRVAAARLVYVLAKL